MVSVDALSASCIRLRSRYRSQLADLPPDVFKR